MGIHISISALAVGVYASLSGCAHPGGGPTAEPTPSASAMESALRHATPLDGSSQLVLVVTPGWDSTSGTLRRFEREGTGRWRQVGADVPVVVGTSGLGWDDARPMPAGTAPIRREGDGRSPAGAFAIDTAFGFDIRQIVPWIRLPYLQLRTTTECVDDVRSAHYNTIVERDRVPSVDWTSAEQMRAIDQYAFGMHVAYNAPPRAGRGSCIFLHIWKGPNSVTAGCTAMELAALRELMGWVDPARRPMLVQLPASVLAQMREPWALP
jgi:D-alanyl-D-alanine dipeptidase